MPTVFRCENLELGHNGTTVLSVPEFSFENGKVYALLGPNGSGKTTLLRALNGFLKPRRGRVLFFGEPLYGASARITACRRRMCLVAQTPLLFDASLLYNVGYGLRVRGQSRGQAARTAREAIERVGLGQYERTNARQLSGGEAQRAAMARALAIRPDVLLLDEPTGNVDVKNTRIIEGIIADAVRDFQVTVILSTHSRRQAARIAHQALHLYQGGIKPASPSDPAGYMWSAEHGTDDDGTYHCKEKN